MGGEYEGLKERLISDTPIYTKGPDYEPLMVPAEAIRHEAAKAITDLQERLSRVEGALETFASFGKQNVTETGWSSSIHREGISVWFGPSDFRRAAALNTGEG